MGGGMACGTSELINSVDCRGVAVLTPSDLGSQIYVDRTHAHHMDGTPLTCVSCNNGAVGGADQGNDR